MRLPSSNRRRPARPSTGDVAVCATCLQGTIEFNERTRDAGTGVTLPAWSCDTCGAITLVRKNKPTSAAVRAASKPLRMHAMRTLMKSRTGRLKARHVLAKSASRKKPKAS